MNIAVVGSNRGIGLEIVKQLVAEDHNVYAYCRKSSSELNDAKPKMIVQNFDVTDQESVASSLKSEDTPKFDWLIHVSGILRSDSWDEVSDSSSDILEQFKVNSLAPITTVKAFEPYLNSESKVGLLTSRMGSITDNSSGGQYGYRMSKAALNMAGKSLSVDLKDKGVTVMLLHPGFVKTEMTNNNGNVEPQESAAGLIEIMKSKDKTGSFWHMNGEPLPW